MKPAICAVLALIASTASAHRLDEYLQLTALSIGKGRVRAKLFLTPGVAVAKRVVALIDANGDGVLSDAERRAYAARVVRDVSLTADGRSVRPRLLAVRFPKVGVMRQGLGEIEIDLDAPVPNVAGGHRLTFENRHQRAIAAYLVECYVPSDPGLRVTGQNRSVEQARYEVHYTQA